MAVINGTNSSNTLRGAATNDVISGLGGADTFYWQSGIGNDTIHGGDTSENYDANPYTPYNPGGDRLELEGSIGANITFSTTEDGIATIGNNKLSFTGIERLYGTAGNDVIRAGNAKLEAAHDGTVEHGLTLYTRGGHDNVVATRFDDIVDGGAGNDTIRMGGGNDLFHSGIGNDLVYGGAGDENIRWGTGNNTHNPGNDTIYGGTGNDLINIWIKDGDIADGNESVGIPGVSVTISQVGSDGSFNGTATTKIGGAATLKFYQFELGWTHAGNDNVSAAGANIAANQAGLNFNTRWGHDVLTGSGGHDILVTDEGRDTITGGTGNDEMWIGAGSDGDGDRDQLIFRRGDGQDTVHGFDTDLDVLSLGGRNYTARETADGTLLNLGNGDTVLLSDVFDFI
jgi:Ca2+-binding RTX toxin-like protein